MSGGDAMSERTSYFGFLVAAGLVLGALVGWWRDE